MSVILAGARGLAGGAVAVMGLIGLQSGLACRYDWSVVGASFLVLAWAARWLLGAMTVMRQSAADRLRRAGDLTHAVGLATAALLFAGHSLTEPWWPFGWWPLVVSLLCAAVAVVCARDSGAFA